MKNNSSNSDHSLIHLLGAEDGFFRIQISDKVASRRIKDWSFAEMIGWGVNCDLWIFRIPNKKYNWVAKELGLPLPLKSPGRVAHGKRLAEARQNKGAGDPSRFKESAPGDKILTSDRPEAREVIDEVC